MKKSLIMIGLVSMSFIACKEEKKDTDQMNDNTTEMEESTSMDNDVDMDENDATTENDNELNLAEVAMNSEDLSTFVAAIQKAGMVVKIKGEGPFTILAPTNEAFNKLPEGTMEDLMKPENAEKLEAALSYHIIPGSVDSSKLKELITTNDDNTYELITANDGKIMASINDKDQVVLTDAKGNKAMVTEVDQKGNNGVIHSINTVLMRK
ncbi:fasciclin domain-containing protein [Mesonia aestuariivivens]|uniref:Fasciclin domain-containing protein n=1 Tax=Mesonia aestuariivivens TaxID=2796128 RepID=A0ABS6W588_9FLAO|nr:fasciclin domain-containing protein [Mesonia aestuariivivens]MBW2962979.1 fasciclin domain-containing protein [Mesonia aestuariivivens]